MLLEPQRSQIFEAIEQAGLDRGEFDLTDDDGVGRLWHKLSGSYFVINRDLTWRYLGHYAVSDGSERLFDLSWRAVIPLMGVWLTELKRHLDTTNM
jgi:hypothetical protein